MKPCIECGEVGERTRCDDCFREKQSAQPRLDKSHPHENSARWKRLSKRLRALQPWCDECSTSESLQANHVVSVHERPDLAYRPENISILCAEHNGARGDSCSPEEREAVYARLRASESAKVRMLAPTAARTGDGRTHPRGVGVSGSGVPSPRQAQTRLVYPRGVSS